MPASNPVQVADHSFAGDRIAPDHARYELSRAVWNGIIDRKPALILRARSAMDVSVAVHVAAERNLPLAVRCGGHSFPGYSTCDGGIVLDLSLMRAITINPIERIAEVDGGALLGDLDRAGNPYGLVTPAGVISHTGAAGLTLGGGMGWRSRRFGLTIDSLIGAEICLADGRLITTSGDQEPDLFWGIRGGGGNFGIVTKFIFRMHPLGNVLVGSWEYPRQHLRTALGALGQLAAQAPRCLTSSFAATRDKLTVTAFWSGDLEGAEAAVGVFSKLAPNASGTIGGVSFLQLQSRNDDRVPWGRRYYSKGGFFDEFAEPAIDAISAETLETPSPDSEIYAIQLGGAVCDIGENETAYSGRSAAFYWIALSAWDDRTDDEKCLAWGRETGKRLAQRSSSRNYVNEQSEVGIAQQAYGAEKYRRLVKLKTKFDPDNLFRLNQNIKPEGSGS